MAGQAKTAVGEPGRVRRAVFPVAGLGTRFLPATKALPKEMLTLVDRPVIQYGVEEAVASGIREIILVTSRGKTAIQDHFDRSPELEIALRQRGKEQMLKCVQSLASLVQVTSVRQKEALGLGHAVLTAASAVGEEPFAVFLPDDVIRADSPCMAQLLQVHARRGGCVLAVEEVDPERVASYGIVDAREIDDGIFQVQDLVEKPDPKNAPSNLAIIGRYVLPPEIFAHLATTAPDRRGEIQLTNALRTLGREAPIHAVRFQGRRYDTGDKLGFLQATVEFGLGDQRLGPAFRRYLKSLDLARAPEALPGSRKTPG
ncbi:MAG: UTP--glucose-1-phosphate uridylyltransferase GalU [Acidobacteriota bacterium]